MSLPWTIAIIVLALAAIVGNILLLKHTAKLPMPSLEERATDAAAKAKAPANTAPTDPNASAQADQFNRH